MIWSDVPQSQSSAGLGDVGEAVVAHDPPAHDPLAVQPRDDTVAKADHRWFLLIRQHLDIGKPGGMIDGDMDLVAVAIGAPLLAISGDPMTPYRNRARDFTSMWIRLPGRYLS